MCYPHIGCMGTEVAFDVRVSRTATPEDVGRERALAIPAPRRPWKAVAVVVVGLALMSSVYTFAVGLAVVLLGLLGLTMPHLARWTMSRDRTSNEHLQGEQLHAIDSGFIRFESERLRARCPWSNLSRWSLQDGRLYLFCRAMPAVVIPQDALVQAGCLQAVLALAERWAGQHAPRRF